MALVPTTKELLSPRTELAATVMIPAAALLAVITALTMDPMVVVIVQVTDLTVVATALDMTRASVRLVAMDIAASVALALAPTAVAASQLVTHPAPEALHPVVAAKQRP